MSRRDGRRRIAGVPAVELDARAGRFLDRLRELGYLEPSTEGDILDRVSELAAGVASFEVVRRIAAEVLFERQIELEHDAFALLDEEWRAIFH